MTENKIVLPGEQVSTSEELAPGDGTFEEDGIIKSSRFGKFQVDQKNRRAVVKPLTSVPVELKKGDTILHSGELVAKQYCRKHMKNYDTCKREEFNEGSFSFYIKGLTARPDTLVIYRDGNEIYRVESASEDIQQSIQEQWFDGKYVNVQLERELTDSEFYRAHVYWNGRKLTSFTSNSTVTFSVVVTGVSMSRRLTSLAPVFEWRIPKKSPKYPRKYPLSEEPIPIN